MYLTDAQDSYIRLECSVQEKKKGCLRISKRIQSVWVVSTLKHGRLNIMVYYCRPTDKIID